MGKWSEGRGGDGGIEGYHRRHQPCLCPLVLNRMGETGTSFLVLPV